MIACASLPGKVGFGLVCVATIFIPLNFEWSLAGQLFVFDILIGTERALLEEPWCRTTAAAASLGFACSMADMDEISDSPEHSWITVTPCYHD